MPCPRRAGAARRDAALGPKRRPAVGNGARIVGTRSIHERPAEALGRQVPGHWEGDVIVGKDGKSVAATLVDRSPRFLVLLALPEGKNDGLSTVLTERVLGMRELVRKSLTWDQGTDMGQHAALTLATGLDVYFTDPAAPGSGPPTRTRTASSSATCPRVERPPTTSPTSTPSPRRSTTSPAAASATAPHKSSPEGPGRRHCFNELTPPTPEPSRGRTCVSDA
ncbi:IS30 family transposase [Streptomyces sp. SID5998]|nr:IS30 family transposase [Streptomyces sp. SID5998]